MKDGVVSFKETDLDANDMMMLLVVKLNANCG